jgi:hypothetical protein
MQTKTKAGAVTFTHEDNFRGEVLIERGGLSITVSIDSLLVMVGARVRHDMIRRLEGMSTNELCAVSAQRHGVDINRIAS